MTPKDKGMLRELLHEYGPSLLISAIAEEAYGLEAGKFLRRLAQNLDPRMVTDQEYARELQAQGGQIPGASSSPPLECRPREETTIGYGLPTGEPTGRPNEPLTLRPQGELLEFEEPKLYGLWNGRDWWRDGIGVVFATEHAGHAIAQARATNRKYAGIWEWTVQELPIDGRPVACLPPNDQEDESVRFKNAGGSTGLVRE